MIPAEYTGPNSLVCMPGVNDFRQLRYTNTSNAHVLWTGPNVEHYLETETDPLTGMIYSYLTTVFILIIYSHIVQLFCFGWNMFIMFVFIKLIITGLWMVFI